MFRSLGFAICLLLPCTEHMYIISDKRLTEWVAKN